MHWAGGKDNISKRAPWMVADFLDFALCVWNKWQNAGCLQGIDKQLGHFCWKYQLKSEIFPF